MSTAVPRIGTGSADDRNPGSGVGTPAPRQEDDQELEAQRVRKPGELWRIEGSVSAVRAEIAQLESLDDEALRSAVAELERRWRAELNAVLPESVVPELHEYFDWLGEVPPRVSELRIGLAQLSGWLDGIIVGLGVSISAEGPSDGRPADRGPS